MKETENYFARSLRLVESLDSLLNKHTPIYNHPHLISWSDEWMASGFRMDWMPNCGMTGEEYAFHIICIADMTDNMRFIPIRCEIFNRALGDESKAKMVYKLSGNLELSDALIIEAYTHWNELEAQLLKKIQNRGQMSKGHLPNSEVD